ncbi:MAG: hypothetical protein DHS20C18_24480 [Saprospiraceae bacterium]|nr:MAG: hypothetical protein DHS20C18_24480 [Saprospiraceae bacterium]
MEKLPTLLFFPQLRYLSNPTFSSVAKELKGYRRIYLDTDLYHNYESPISPDEMDELSGTYDEIIQLGLDKNLTNTGGRLSRLKRYHQLVKEIKALTTEYKPSAFIFPSDIIFELRVVKRHFPKIKRIILQPCQRKFVLKKTSLRRKIYYYFFNYLIGIPLYSRSKMFGDQDNKAHYVFWSKKWVASLAQPQKTITYISGAPAYDIIFKQEANKSFVLPPQFFSENKKIVTFFLNKKTSAGKEAFEEFASLYKAFIIQHPHLAFILKIHPLEDKEYCTNLFREVISPNVHLIDKELTTPQLLANSSIIITQWSSIINEALINDIPVVLCNPQGKHDLKNRFLDDFKYVAKTLAELIKLVDDILLEKIDYSSFKGEYLENSIGFVDGQNSKRAAKIIETIIA